MSEAAADLIWVHLADLGFDERGPTSLHHRLRDEIAHEAEHSGTPALLLVSGNLVRRAEVRAFAQATKWLGSLASRLGVPAERVVCAPGPLDLSPGPQGRTPLTDLLHEQLALQPGRLWAYLDRAAPDSRDLLLGKLNLWREAIRNLGSKAPEGLGSETSAAGPGGAVRVLALNAAMLSTGEEGAKEPEALLGEEQLQLARASSAGVPTVLVLHRAPGEFPDGRTVLQSMVGRPLLVMVRGSAGPTLLPDSGFQLQAGRVGRSLAWNHGKLGGNGLHLRLHVTTEEGEVGARSESRRFARSELPAAIATWLPPEISVPRAVPPGGPYDARLYVERPAAEAEARKRLEASGLILVAPRRSGKSWIVERVFSEWLAGQTAQGLEVTRIVVRPPAAGTFSEDDFLRAFEEATDAALPGWREGMPPSGTSLYYRMRRSMEHLLGRMKRLLVLHLPEGDPCFRQPWSRGLVGLIRDWTERPKEQLRVILELSERPEVVGSSSSSILTLDLTGSWLLEPAQVRVLAARHGLDWSLDTASEVNRTVGGHPWLADLAAAWAARQEGPLVVRKLEDPASSVFDDALRYLGRQVDLLLDRLHPLRSELRDPGEAQGADPGLQAKLQALGLIKPKTPGSGKIQVLAPVFRSTLLL